MDNLITFFTDPMGFDFMQRALLTALLVGTACSLFSCFLVLKGWSLMGDAISHALLPGLALAVILGIPLSVGAFGAGLFCAVGTGFIKENSRVKEDAIMGIIFSGMFALGLVMLTKIKTDIHLLHILFGNILGVSQSDLLELAIIAIACSTIMIIKHRDFMLYCFDENHARVLGLPVKLLHFSLLALLALTIVSALKATGIILVISMLIAPGAIGLLLTKQFEKMMVIALIASILSCTIGTFISFHIDVATAPLIVVIQAGLFCIALIINKIQTR